MLAAERRSWGGRGPWRCLLASFPGAGSLARLPVLSPWERPLASPLYRRSGPVSRGRRRRRVCPRSPSPRGCPSCPRVSGASSEETPASPTRGVRSAPTASERSAQPSKGSDRTALPRLRLSITTCEIITGLSFCAKPTPVPVPFPGIFLHME